ncbi:polyamine-modulated factor 1-binding protein 1 [Colletes gigas]|uniref:polyamine-modulated factor 1-binding protein 1 n=1 Tax=Colletes gigas TaxID=935657 RepID=UPI001C9B254F|nr:polyamine-modulated factor 1-binding protein 1 [Colletes gigas]
MTEDLLIKEKGFRQLNKELEQKAHDLMKNVDRVINTYNNECLISNSKNQCTHFKREQTKFSEYAATQKEANSQVSVKRNSSLPYIFGQVSSKLKVEAQQDFVDDASKKGNLANKTIINLLKAKIDMLQTELQTLQIEYRKKCNLCMDLESEQKKIELKLQNEIESLKNTITKLENTNKELQCQSQALNSESSIIKKNLEKLQKEVKGSKQQSDVYSMRLNRSLENNNKLRNALKCSQIEEKELRNQIRKLQDDKRMTVNNLGKQLSELAHVFKKQMLIIDNLKKQNACLIGIGQLKFTQEEFSRLLDQKSECLC